MVGVPALESLYAYSYEERGEWLGLLPVTNAFRAAGLTVPFDVLIREIETAGNTAITIAAMEVAQWLPRRSDTQTRRVATALLPLMADPRVYETRISPSDETVRFPLAEHAVGVHIFLFAHGSEELRGQALVDAATRLLSTEVTASYAQRLVETKPGPAIARLVELFADVFADEARPVSVRIKAHEFIRNARSRAADRTLTESVLTQCAPILATASDPALKAYAARVR